MGNLGHQAARLAASKICDNIVKGLCKDPETEVVKLIDMWQKFMGDEKIDLNYDSVCIFHTYQCVHKVSPSFLSAILIHHNRL